MAIRSSPRARSAPIRARSASPTGFSAGSSVIGGVARRRASAMPRNACASQPRRSTAYRAKSSGRSRCPLRPDAEGLAKMDRLNREFETARRALQRLGRAARPCADRNRPHPRGDRSSRTGDRGARGRGRPHLGRFRPASCWRRSTSRSLQAAERPRWQSSSRTCLRSQLQNCVARAAPARSLTPRAPTNSSSEGGAVIARINLDRGRTFGDAGEAGRGARVPRARPRRLRRARARWTATLKERAGDGEAGLEACRGKLGAEIRVPTAKAIATESGDVTLTLRSGS